MFQFTETLEISGAKITVNIRLDTLSGAPNLLYIRQFYNYTRKTAQVVISLQTSCNKSVYNLSTSCACILVCCNKFGTSC